MGLFSVSLNCHTVGIFKESKFVTEIIIGALLTRTLTSLGKRKFFSRVTQMKKELKNEKVARTGRQLSPENMEPVLKSIPATILPSCLALCLSVFLFSSVSVLNFHSHYGQSFFT